METNLAAFFPRAKSRTRIIYATDIHGDFEKLKNLLYETVADIYIIGGDLIDIPFYNMETSMRYHELQTRFHDLRHRMGRDDVLLEDFVEELLSDPGIEDDLGDLGAKYLQLTIRARRVMQQKYKLLKNFCMMKKKARLLCLPGNYDMDLRYTALHADDLHLKRHRIHGLRISGYGGADVWTMGIPQRYIVKYKQDVGNKGWHAEMYRFLKASRPDIIVAHKPAYGIQDGSGYAGPFGSYTMRAYCEKYPVKMCLTGHAHDAWGVTWKHRTLFMNPGNFGEVTLTNGTVNEGGFFYQIELGGKKIERIIYRKIHDNKVYDVADYYLKASELEQVIIDEGRYAAQTAGRNYDTREVKYSHVPEIRLFNEIRNFYRMFQTPDSEDRLDMLEDVTQCFKDRLDGNIAMDVLGSVNMGTSLPDSDIDFVLYFRHPECEENARCCRYLKGAEDLIKAILGPQVRFQILDCLNLCQIEQAILARDYEDELLQRFVAYRSIGRPVNYRVLAPMEDLLNADLLFRREIEGSVQAYFKIFATTTAHQMSFKKYESRLNAIGIKLPESIRDKVRDYLSEHKKD